MTVMLSTLSKLDTLTLFSQPWTFGHLETYPELWLFPPFRRFSSGRVADSAVIFHEQTLWLKRR